MLTLPLTLSGLPGLPTINEEMLIWFIQYKTLLQWDPCRRQHNCVELYLTCQCELGACHIAALGVALPEVQLILLTFKNSVSAPAIPSPCRACSQTALQLVRKTFFGVTCACQGAPKREAATAVYPVRSTALVRLFLSP